MRWLSINESDMPPAMDQEIRRGLCVAFPDDIEVYTHTRAWHDSHPVFSVVLEDGGRILAHVGVTDRMVTAGGVPLRSAGVMNVFVDPGERGKKLGDAAVKQAMDEADKRGFDIGLLFCKPFLEKLYAGMGWLWVGNRTIIRVDVGNEVPLPGKNMAMYFPLRYNTLPEGTLHLRGNDW